MSTDARSRTRSAEHLGGASPGIRRLGPLEAVDLLEGGARSRDALLPAMPARSRLSALRPSDLLGWRLGADARSHRHHPRHTEWHGDSVLSQISRDARRAGSLVSENGAFHGRLFAQGVADAKLRQISGVHALDRHTRQVSTA